MIKRAFTEHPASVGESYVEHMGCAFSFGSSMLIGGVACLLHGLFPFAFTKSGSRRIEVLYRRMVTHRDRRGPAYNKPAAPLPAMERDAASARPAE